MRNKTIISTYQDTEQNQTYEKYYAPQYDFDEDLLVPSTGSLMTSIGRDLPADIDIFSELPSEVFVLPEVGEMLSALKQVLSELPTDGVTLSKLRISEYTAESLVLDWIFNYFRVYFSFDFNGDDSFGMIANNPVEDSFFTSCKRIKESQYSTVASEVIAFVLDKLIG